MISQSAENDKVIFGDIFRSNAKDALLWFDNRIKNDPLLKYFVIRFKQAFSPPGSRSRVEIYFETKGNRERTRTLAGWIDYSHFDNLLEPVDERVVIMFVSCWDKWLALWKQVALDFIEGHELLSVRIILNENNADEDVSDNIIGGKLLGRVSNTGPFPTAYHPEVLEALKRKAPVGEINYFLEERLSKGTKIQIEEVEPKLEEVESTIENDQPYKVSEKDLEYYRKHTGSRFPNPETIRRAEVIKRLKDQNPDWTMEKMVMEASDELGLVEFKKRLNVNSIRYIFRIFGWKWQKGERNR